MENSWIEKENPGINPNFISLHKGKIEKELQFLKNTKYLQIAENLISELIEGREQKPYKRGTITLRGDIFYSDVFFYVSNSVPNKTKNQQITRSSVYSYVTSRLRLEGFDVHS